jgi:hypothetical protein
VVGPYGSCEPQAAGSSSGTQRQARITYELRVFRTPTGSLVGSFNTGGNLGITIDPALLTQSSVIYYEVIAFAGQSFVCTSGRIGGLTVGQAFNPNFNASAYCAIDRYYISWNGALPSDTIFAEIDSFLTSIGYGSSGSGVVECDSHSPSVTVSTSSGAKITLNVSCGN